MAERQLADRLQASAGDIAILFSGGGCSRQHETPEQHLARLQTRFEASGLNPRFVNLLAGNDRWPLAQQVDFLGKARAGRRVWFDLRFETHRATSLYSPWLTEIIAAPQLRFTADISHWVVVSERLLDDPSDDFSAFIDRVHHVQARVGYDEAAGAAPAAPEYQPALALPSASASGVRSASAATRRPR